MNDLVVTLNNIKLNIVFNDDSTVSIDNKKYYFNLIELERNKYLLHINNKLFEIITEGLSEEKYSVLVNGNLYNLNVQTSLQQMADSFLQQNTAKSKIIEIKAPMPGKIIKLKKNIGETIVQGETILILEAMKMENDLRAPNGGKIKNIFVEEGSTVEKGAALLIIE